MSNEKILIICKSIHHGNTLKIAKIIAKELNADIKKPSEVKSSDFNKYTIIGFGSGIYDEMHHKDLLNLVDELPESIGKKTFIFSTSGVPVAILGNKFLKNYMPKAHASLKNKLESKSYKVIGDFISPGFNTNVFLKYIGGLNKNRPNHKDFESAKEFTLKIKEHF